MTKFAEYRGIGFNFTPTQFVVFTALADGPLTLYLEGKLAISLSFVPH